jgi:hypothetical protein
MVLLGMRIKSRAESMVTIMVKRMLTKRKTTLAEPVKPVRRAERLGVEAAKSVTSRAKS